MGYTRPTETTKYILETSPLPSHGDTYTVIPHKDVMNHTEQLLAQNGFMIEKVLYRANMNAQVAQGIYHIKAIPQVFSLYSSEVQEEEDLGMMFAWTNSYDKSTRFQCAIGAYVMCCNNGVVCGDMANFARKHTGSADTEVHAQISSQIKSAHKFFKTIVNDKNNLRTITLSTKEQAELLGRLFFDNKLLDVTQMSCIKSEMNESSYDYKSDADSAWTFYNNVTHAFKKTHPRNWLSDQQKFHEFIVADVLGKMGVNQKDTIDPNQVMTESELSQSIDGHAAVKETLDINETESEPIPTDITVENQHAHRVHTGVEVMPGDVSESIFKEEQDKANMSADLETSDQGKPFYTEEANDEDVYDNSIKVSEEKEIDFEEDGSFEI